MISFGIHKNSLWGEDLVCWEETKEQDALLKGKMIKIKFWAATVFNEKVGSKKTHNKIFKRHKEKIKKFITPIIAST